VKKGVQIFSLRKEVWTGRLASRHGVTWGKHDKGRVKAEREPLITEEKAKGEGDLLLYQGRPDVIGRRGGGGRG